MISAAAVKNGNDLLEEIEEALSVAYDYAYGLKKGFPDTPEERQIDSDLVFDCLDDALSTFRRFRSMADAKTGVVQ